MPQSPLPPDYMPRELFDDSISLHEHCMGAGLMEAGYHALASAMLCAQAASSRRAIELVIELAHEQQRAIDAERPPHRLSSGESLARGAAPLFEGIAAAAEAIRGGLTRAGARGASPRPVDIPG